MPTWDAGGTGGRLTYCTAVPAPMTGVFMRQEQGKMMGRYGGEYYVMKEAETRVMLGQDKESQGLPATPEAKKLRDRTDSLLELSEGAWLTP